MLFGYLGINGRLVWWLTMVPIVAGITLTVSPSSNVEVNQTVTLRCALDPNPAPPVVVIFKSGIDLMTILCVLEPNNGTCKNTSFCSTCYNYANCLNGTVFSIEINVPKSWNGTSIQCQTVFSTSNYINFSVKVPVTSVTLTPTSITLIAGQQGNLTCTTSYCYPLANITWYKSMTDITSQSTYTTDVFDSLVKTTSQLMIRAVKLDNEKRVYCTASNIPGQSVQSEVHLLIVLYKPEVAPSTKSPYIVIEGQTAILECTLLDANPYTGIIWKWFKTDSPDDMLENGPIYTIPDIQRNSSGLFHCIAINVVGTSEPLNIYIDVNYKPEVISSTPSPYRIVEGDTATLVCRVTAANPNSNITWKWYKTDNPSNVLHNESTLSIPNIQRSRSGLYRCTASNVVGTSVAATTIVDIDCEYVV